VSTHASHEADGSARAAAQRLGLRVAELTDTASHHAAAVLLQQVWRADNPDVVCNAPLMTALAHGGNYVAGGYLGDRLVAVAVGFFGEHALHSHVTGVDRTIGTPGIGFAMKLHQRAWALARGITTVCWTYDPLIARNAYFNLHKLGAAATEYLPDFYGELDDGVNAGDPTDRLVATWELNSPAAVAAAAGRPEGLAASFDEATVLLGRSGERPVPAGTGLPGDGRPLRVAVPVDAETLRQRDPAAAAQWRFAVRAALSDALAAGYHVRGISRDAVYALAVPAGPDQPAVAVAGREVA
jgi:predicted GNAT superfamily acetyltransferase